MAAHLVRRLLATCLLVLAISSAAFLVTRLAPGDSADIALGLGANSEALTRARHLAGLDRSLAAQWAGWLAGVARLDFGETTLYQRPVGPLVAERALNTALLAVTSFLVALAIGLPLALATASRPTSALARLVRGVSLLLLSMPPFVGSLVLVLLAVRTGWLPAGGMTSGDGSTGIDLAVDLLWHLPLPVLALALPLGATFERLQSQSLGQALAEPSVQAARARGVPERQIVRRHAWRLAVKPVAAVGGLAFGALLSGSFVVEMVTAWPGLGRLTYDALRHRDLDLVAGCAAAGTLLLAIGLLASDLVIAWSDPRVRDNDARAGVAA